MKKTELKSLTVRQLLSLFADVVDELQERGVTHSTNNPIANYSEYLVKKALSLTIMAESNLGYDAVDSQGKKYEIKGRRPTAKNKSRQLSQIRGLDKKHFDYLIGIIYLEDLSVFKACVIPHEVVQKNSTFKAHTNSWVFYLKDEIWDIPGVRDVTAELKKAEIG
jgi:hypothetical protein